VPLWTARSGDVSLPAMILPTSRATFEILPSGSMNIPASQPCRNRARTGALPATSPVMHQVYLPTRTFVSAGEAWRIMPGFVSQ
jgi:hypothetical protein